MLYRHCIAALWIAIIGFIATTGFAQNPSVSIDAALISGSAPAGYVEFSGVEAGAFEPRLWQNSTLNLVPDYRFPFMMPLNGTWRNIYAPSAVETPNGYRLFYGAWDGIPEGKDRIYSGDADFEFLNVTNRHSVALPGSYHHLCNVNAIRMADGSYRFVATTWPVNNWNKPAFFQSDTTGTNWNGFIGEPYTVRSQDFITMTGYTNASGDAFPSADINGVNVILHEDGMYRFYFGDFKDIPNGGLQVYRASSANGKNYTFEGKVLTGNNAVNDVKKFIVGTNVWYLMGSHLNGDRLWYTLSTNALSFPSVKTLMWHMNAVDRYIVALGWVVKGEQEEPGRKLLGVLYGAGAVSSLDQNRIFARWLQKKVVFVGEDGTRFTGTNSFGPDRQLIALPGTNAFNGHIEVYGEDGTNFLGRSLPFSVQNGQRIRIGFPPQVTLDGLLHNTGVDQNGALLGSGSVDPHYQLISSADPAWNGPSAYVVNEPLATTAWLTNGPSSKWIAPRANATNLPGVYVYRTSLTLTNIDPRLVSVTGQWVADNAGTNILINGVTNAVTTTQRGSWRTFAIANGLTAGMNFIDFVHRNTGTSANLCGIRIEVEARAALPAGFTAPSITAHPLGRHLREGGNVTLQCAAQGTLPLSFQWEYNGTALQGETNQTLALLNLKPEESGNYRARVENVAGHTYTSAANIEVAPVVAPAFQSFTQTGTNLSFQVTGAAGDRYGLLVSSNLVQWTGVKVIENTSGTVQVTEAILPDATRFYRLVVLP